MSPDPAMVSEAIVVWTGWGTASWPVRDDRRVVERFGAELAANLVPRVRELEENFYSSDARYNVPDLAAMGDAAARQFRSVHPDISEDAVQALTWCYTFDHK